MNQPILFVSYIWQPVPESPPTTHDWSIQAILLLCGQTNCLMSIRPMTFIFQVFSQGNLIFSFYFFLLLSAIRSRLFFSQFFCLSLSLIASLPHCLSQSLIFFPHFFLIFKYLDWLICQFGQEIKLVIVVTVG